MLQRDLLYLNKTCESLGFYYSNKTQFCQALGASSAMIYQEPLSVQPFEGVYQYRFKGNKIDEQIVDFYKSNEQLFNNKGEQIAIKLSDEAPRPFTKVKGEYCAYFNRKELFDCLKNINKMNAYRHNTYITFNRLPNKWVLINHGLNLINNTLSISKRDKIVCENFNFTTECKNLCNIIRWLKSDTVVFWFNDICGTQTEVIYVYGNEAIDRGRKAVIVPVRVLDE